MRDSLSCGSGRGGGGRDYSRFADRFGRYAAHQRGQAVKEERLLDRLDETIINARGFQLFRIQPAAQGRQQHEPDIGQPAFGPNAARQGQAIRSRHVQIQEDDLVGIAGGASLPQLVERLGAVRRRAAAHLPGARLVLQDFAIGLVVVHDEHVQVDQVTSNDGLSVQALRLPGQSGREPKSGTATGGAFDSELALHHFDQLPRNGEAQPVPPYFRLVDASAWLKAWNKRA